MDFICRNSAAHCPQVDDVKNRKAGLPDSTRLDTETVAPPTSSRVKSGIRLPTWFPTSGKGSWTTGAGASVGTGSGAGAAVGAGAGITAGAGVGSTGAGSWAVSCFAGVASVGSDAGSVCALLGHHHRFGLGPYGLSRRRLWLFHGLLRHGFHNGWLLTWHLLDRRLHYQRPLLTFRGRG